MGLINFHFKVSAASKILISRCECRTSFYQFLLKLYTCWSRKSSACAWNALQLINQRCFEYNHYKVTKLEPMSNAQSNTDHFCSCKPDLNSLKSSTDSLFLFSGCLIIFSYSISVKWAVWFGAQAFCSVPFEAT